MEPKPLAKADRPRKGPFAELLARCRQDGDALKGLAFAYHDLVKLDRRKLIDVVIKEMIEPQDVLATFLAVEEDVELARVLAGELSARGVRQAPLMRWASMREQGNAGEAHLVQRLHGPFAEVLRITWHNDEVRSVKLEPMAHLNESTGLDRAPIEHVVERLASMLWRHSRVGGTLPPGAERFANWF